MDKKLPSETWLEVSMKLSMETSGNLPETFRETSNLISNVGNFLHRISTIAKLILFKLNINWKNQSKLFTSAKLMDFSSDFSANFSLQFKVNIYGTAALELIVLIMSKVSEF